MIQQLVIYGHLRLKKFKYYSHFHLHAPFLRSLRLHFYCSRIAPECTDHDFLPKPQHASVYVDTPKKKLHVSFGADICFTGVCRECEGNDIPLELEKWGGHILSVWYIWVTWIHVKQLFMIIGVDSEESSSEVKQMTGDNRKAVYWNTLWNTL